jgi:hypothetical protein
MILEIITPKEKYYTQRTFPNLSDNAIDANSLQVPNSL